MNVLASKAPPLRAVSPSSSVARDEAALKEVQRLYVRCTIDFALDALAPLVVSLKGDVTSATLLMAVAQATQTPDGSPLDRRISILAAAGSLGVPYETARRHAGDLVARGFADRSRDGLVLTPAAAALRAAQAEAGRQRLRRLLADLRALGAEAAEPKVLVTAERDPKRLAELGFGVEAFLLRVLEAGVPVYGSQVAGLVFCALMLANSQRIQRDPDLAWRYSGADTPPPDGERRPATVREVAARLGMPHENVRRRIQAMTEAGKVERVRGGRLASQVFMQSPEMLESGLLVTQRFLQLMDGLHRLDA